MELNGTILLQVFIFLTLLIWLSKTLFAPILRLFEEREQRIDGARRIAAEQNALADEKSQIFFAEYEKAKIEARHALTALKNDMEREYSEAISQAKAIAREKLLVAERELQAQEQKIREDLFTKSASIADEIVKVMVRKSA